MHGALLTPFRLQEDTEGHMVHLSAKSALTTVATIIGMLAATGIVGTVTPRPGAFPGATSTGSILSASLTGTIISPTPLTGHIIKA